MPNRTDPERAPRPHLAVVGGGLAGCEAAWQAAQRGVDVTLYEMRPRRTTPAHTTDRLAELVCSNSLGSTLPDRSGGLLKSEMRLLGSLVLAAAEAAALPAGGALAVDRALFAEGVTAALEAHPRITVVREEVTRVPDGPAVIATGPLTSDLLAADLVRLTGAEHLYFYDALAPIVAADSIDMGIAFRGSRWGRGETEAGDYINCPMNEAEFTRFYDALCAAERIPLPAFEDAPAPVANGSGAVAADAFFEGCLPIEVIARRGKKSLTFGPMRPVGLRDPRSEGRPYAVVQLRQDNVAATLYNLVGFQTNVRWGEQEAVLRLIPGLEAAEFVRLGQMHRNTYINSPVLLRPTMAMRDRPDLFFAGQITGIEGYTGNAASGLVAGANAARAILGRTTASLPVTTMLGALCHYVTHADPAHFQPMKSNFGLMPPLDAPPRAKADRHRAYADRALADLAVWADDVDWGPPPALVPARAARPEMEGAGA
ncbi:MAG: methylenetetrahydrofolate--tRNA-(uracil(54)-C(5))-methyltransferase (FADH(2)-oxidizing) TrmFO [Ardenticatenales bacterium]|nr:methylenetetrahydrofolate--tRNA-(uracil(54)-C(5))-methyltransferase (FADH(2)-oxidizing) TrmFO [Ardenticatenales bacterium]